MKFANAGKYIQSLLSKLQVLIDTVPETMSALPTISLSNYKRPVRPRLFHKTKLLK